MPDHQGVMPTQGTKNIITSNGSLPWGTAFGTAALAFVLVFSVYLLLRPPLYNYDGYTYRLEALQPLQGDNLNPHHLLWYPIQKGIAALSTVLGSPSPEAFQLSGILINSFALALLCLLLVWLTHRRVLPMAMTIFIAFSPHIWSLGLQNQPYTLLNFCIVAFLWAVAEWNAPSRLRWTTSGLALASAVLLQQAMALAVPAVAIGFIIAGPGRWKTRLWRASAWVGGITLGVAAVYVLMARAAGVEPGGFLNWTLEYMQDQHGIQVQWPQTAIKCVIGMAGAVVESSWIRDRFNPQSNSAALWRLYGTLLVVVCVASVAILSRRRVRERLVHLLRSNPSFASVLMMVLAWSGFVLLWEPTGHFWGVMLFPLAFLASWWVRVSRKQTAMAVAGALLVVSSWNLHANHRQDQAYSVNFPPPMLEQIRAELGPQDVFIIAGRDWYANRDYSLLLECLDDWPRDPAMALLDDYVMKGSQKEWQQKLDTDIRAAFAAGGRVYVADHVFWPDSYRDLEQTADPFSAYAHMEYAGLGGERLTGEIKSFFDRYRLVPSGFKVGTDPYWELKRNE